MRVLYSLLFAVAVENIQHKNIAYLLHCLLVSNDHYEWGNTDGTS